MAHPIRAAQYKFQGVPLTETEKKKAKKAGDASKTLRGMFSYRGTKVIQGRKVMLIFREQATIEDGVITTGRTIVMTTDDFKIGLDLGKIKGRSKKAA